MPRNITASNIGNGVISLLWQLRCHCIPDHDKFSSLSNKTVVAIFPNVCLWRRSYAQNWEVLTLKNCYSIAPPSYASAASVVASYGPRFFSTVRFGKIRATCENFLGKWFTAPPLAKNFPYAYGCSIATSSNTEVERFETWTVDFARLTSSSCFQRIKSLDRDYSY